MSQISLANRERLRLDETNPRKADAARLSLLRLSIAKLGFVMPLYATSDGMLLSGHQRTGVADTLKLKVLPVEFLTIDPDKIRGINIVFNRATNDFGALDTGASVSSKINIQELIAELEQLPTLSPRQWPVLAVKDTDIRGYAKTISGSYDKKAVVVANNLIRMGIKIPIVVSKSGRVVNGKARIFSALENEITEWPTVTIADNVADLAEKLLNYLSMDFDVSADMANLLRSCAFRRPQNARGHVPKAMRFWASMNRTVSDKDAYSSEFWCKWREHHGGTILDFGSGLSKSAPFLRKKGIDALDFEPYMIDMSKNKSQPDLAYSRTLAKAFLDQVAGGIHFDSIFLCSVLNSVPFAEDRLKVLCIVHALCGFSTKVYGTCRDISDHQYEYSGIRQANYFVFDSESGVRIGDYMSNPKIQKFHTQEEAANMLHKFWAKYEFHKGGNIFYFEASCPYRPNYNALITSLKFEFNLPFKGGETLDLAEYALRSFGKRLGVDLVAMDKANMKLISGAGKKDAK